jgi:hypothetical protein
MRLFRALLTATTSLFRPRKPGPQLDPAEVQKQAQARHRALVRAIRTRWVMTAAEARETLQWYNEATGRDATSIADLEAWHKVNRITDLAYIHDIKVALATSMGLEASGRARGYTVDQLAGFYCVTPELIEAIRDGREHGEVPGWNDRLGPVVPATKRELFPGEYKSQKRSTARRRVAAKARTVIKRASPKARTKVRAKGGRA